MIGRAIRWLVIFSSGLVFLFACVFNPALAWTILFLVGGGWIARKEILKRNEAERQERKALRERTIADAIAKCVGAHRELLLLKREQGVFLDEYGKLEDSAWRNEVKKFTNRVVLDEVPDARNFSEESIVGFTRKMIEKVLGPASPQSRQCGFQ